MESAPAWKSWEWGKFLVQGGVFFIPEPWEVLEFFVGGLKASRAADCFFIPYSCSVLPERKKKIGVKRRGIGVFWPKFKS